MRSGGDRIEGVGQRSRSEEIKDAVRELTGIYDQLDLQNEAAMSIASAPRYNAAASCSRESLEYTRKWVENNDTAPSVSLCFCLYVYVLSVC